MGHYRAEMNLTEKEERFYKKQQAKLKKNAEKILKKNPVKLSNFKVGMEVSLYHKFEEAFPNEVSEALRVLGWNSQDMESIGQGFFSKKLQFFVSDFCKEIKIHKIDKKQGLLYLGKPGEIFGYHFVPLYSYKFFEPIPEPVVRKRIAKKK